MLEVERMATKKWKDVSMKLGEEIFKFFAARMPRVRGLSHRYYFAHPFLDAWFTWFPLNQIEYGGASIGEIYNVAARIDERSGASWTKEWFAEGERLEALAEQLFSLGRMRSAAMVSLRAYTCYRTAHLATDPVSSKEALQVSYAGLKRCFLAYAQQGPHSISPIVIPFEKEGMAGYMMKPETSDVLPRPTVLWLNGAETISEDMLWWCGAEGVERGFNVVCVDMPGDTATRIDRPSLLLKDPGDAALMAQLDFLCSHPEVDPDSLFVYGISMGGYKASRLAGLDSRARAIVANAPMLNAGKVLDEVKKIPDLSKEAHGWAYRMLWQYGIDDHANLKSAINLLVNDVWASFETNPEAVTSPFLTLVGENELGGEGLRQAREFHSRIAATGKAERITTFAEGAESHCQLNNFPLARQIVFDWFEVFLSNSNGRGE